MTNDRTPQLTRIAWVREALAVLAESGIEQVRIEPLARRLKVSKGSFYWHFKDRADLLTALVAFWETEMTGDLITHLAPLPNPRARLDALSQAVLMRTDGGIDVAQAEVALREWAGRDPLATPGMRRVDEKRSAYLKQEFIALGAEPEQAERFARALYMTLIGLFAARRTTPALADDQAFLEMSRLIADTLAGT